MATVSRRPVLHGAIAASTSDVAADSGVLAGYATSNVTSGPGPLATDVRSQLAPGSLRAGLSKLVNYLGIATIAVPHDQRVALPDACTGGNEQETSLMLEDS
jgi:hypothetical protein